MHLSKDALDKNTIYTFILKLENFEFSQNFRCTRIEKKKLIENPDHFLTRF